MKKLLTFIAIATFGIAMVSCGNAESKKRKAYQRETESVLSGLSMKAQTGWRYIQKNLADDEELWLLGYQELDEIKCKTSPLNGYGFDGLSIGLYDVVNSDDEKGILAVYFKSGGPRMLSDKSTFMDFPKLVILLLDAWDDRTDTEKALEKAGRNVVEQMRLQQSIRDLRQGL